MAAFEEGHNEALGIQIRRQGVLVDGIDVIDFQEIVVGCLPVTVHLDDYGVFDDQILKREICCFRSAGGKELSKRSEEHTSELKSLMRTSYAGFCFQKKNT